MVPTLCLLVLVSCFTPTLSSQILTEIHPVPAAGEPEWVELYNPTGRTITLRNYRLCDGRSCVELPELTIAARTYVVLTTSPEALQESRTIRDPVQVALPSLNNTTDAVYLRDADSSLIDHVVYSMKDHVKGRSIERYGRWEQDDIVFDTTWATCVAFDSATCGTLNSVITLRRDLSILPIIIRDASIDVVVGNVGQVSTSSVELTVTIGDVVLSHVVPPMKSSDADTFSVALSDLGWPMRSGRQQVHIDVNTRDDRSANNAMNVDIILPPRAGTVVLNEIMFDPFTGNKDYVELINIGADTIDLSNWIIEDGSVDRSVTNTVIRLPPDSIMALIGGVNVKPDLSLNASGDRVTVRTPSGFVVDDVTYYPSWHHPMLPNGKGVSLEKIAPELASAAPSSWTSSGDLSGGTPGAANSQRTLVEFSTSMTASPSPFSSDPSDVRHPCILSYVLPFQQAIVTLHVRRWDGSYVTTLLNSVFTGSEAAVAWPGTSADGTRVPPGMYIGVIEAVDAGSNRTHRAVCSIVVGN